MVQRVRRRRAGHLRPPLRGRHRAPDVAAARSDVLGRRARALRDATPPRARRRKSARMTTPDVPATTPTRTTRAHAVRRWPIAAVLAVLLIAAIVAGNGHDRA